MFIVVEGSLNNIRVMVYEKVEMIVVYAKKGRNGKWTINRSRDTGIW